MYKAWLVSVSLAAFTLAALTPGLARADGTAAPPHPDVWIASPAEDLATEADRLEVLVGFAAWVDPLDPTDIGSVHDIDLLLNGELAGTYRNRPGVKTGTAAFDLSLADLPPGAHEIQARACHGNRRAGHWGESRIVRIFRGCTWPNGESRANSDPWIAEHHDALCGMEPRLLVLNFSNDTTMSDAERLTRQLVGALKESSRWHGFENASAPAFLNYRVDKIVDMRDDPPVATCDGNSTLYPRVPDPDAQFNFVYADLYTDAFAAHYGYPDPDDASRFLTLAELVDRGVIHEVWFFANHRDCGAPFESVELKQFYDESFEKAGHGPAGNGHDFGIPWIGRSLRITFINPDRGIGCAMENLAHAMEHMRHAGAIPYYSRYFTEYAGFDLDSRWGLPFESFYWYGGDDGNEYPDPGTLVSSYRGSTIVIDDYVATGGNAHFTPNGRHHYDLDNPAAVMSTIEHWRLGDGAGDDDLAEAFTSDDFGAYRTLADGCMGPWLVYWRQNMPGYRNLARDDDGRPMKNWWPFLFY